MNSDIFPLSLEIDTAPLRDVESLPSSDNQQQQHSSTSTDVDLTSADIDGIINAFEACEDSAIELPPPAISVPPSFSSLCDQEGHVPPASLESSGGASSSSLDPVSLSADQLVHCSSTGCATVAPETNEVCSSARSAGSAVFASTSHHLTKRPLEKPLLLRPRHSPMAPSAGSAVFASPPHHLTTAYSKRSVEKPLLSRPGGSIDSDDTNTRNNFAQYMYEDIGDLMNDMAPPPPYEHHSEYSPVTGTSGKVEKDSGRNLSVNKSPTERVKAARKSCNGTSSRIRSDKESGDNKKTHRFVPFQNENWNQRLTELRQFRRQNGHALVPHAYTPNPQLARWVKRQRRQYKLLRSGKASTMTADRAAILEDAGFVWDSHEASWRERLQELMAYKDKFDDCLVPKTYKDNPRLATWVKCQRRQYKLYCKGEPSGMNPSRIADLEAAGFIWEVRPDST